MVCGNDQDQGERCDHVERNKAVARVIGEVRIDGGGDRHLPGCTDEHGVAVGWLARNKFGRDASTRTDPVLDDSGSAGIFLELLHDQPREQVVAASGGKSDNEVNCAVRILSLCACDASRQCNKQSRKRADHYLFYLDHCIPLGRAASPAAHVKAYTGSDRGKTPLSAMLPFATGRTQ